MLFTKEQLIAPNNRRYTQALFRELSAQPEVAIMTLLGRDIEGYTNIRTIFVQYCTEDPSEYSFAEYVFGDWDHWELILNNRQIQSHFDKWRDEAAIARKGIAFKTIVDMAKGKSPSSLSAAKLLIDEPWIPKKDKKATVKKNETTKKAASAVQSDIESLKEKGLLQ